MKKIFLLSIALMGALSMDAQLLNPGFEQADTLGQPANWGQVGMIAIPIDTSCSWIGADSVRLMTSDAHTGNYAYMMGVATYCSSGYGGSAKMRRFDTDSFVDQRILFTLRPTAFTFYYKALPLQGDELLADVALENQNGTVADGILKIQQVAQDWTLGTIALDYRNTETPEFLSLTFKVRSDSVIHYGTRFTIDDVDYTMPTTVGEMQSNRLNVLTCYPVPARDELVMKATGINSAVEAMVSITDGIGRAVKTEKVRIDDNSELRSNIKELPAGMYFVKMQTKDMMATGKFVKQ